MFRKISFDRIPPTYGYGYLTVLGSPEETESGYIRIPIGIRPAEGTNGSLVRFNLLFKPGWLTGAETPDTRGERFVYRRSIAGSSRDQTGFLEVLYHTSEKFRSMIDRAKNNGDVTPDLLYEILTACDGELIGYRLEQERERLDDGSYVRTDRMSPASFFSPTEENLDRLTRQAESGRIRVNWNAVR